MSKLGKLLTTLLTEDATRPVPHVRASEVAPLGLLTCAVVRLKFRVVWNFYTSLSLNQFYLCISPYPLDVMAHSRVNSCRAASVAFYSVGYDAHESARVAVRSDEGPAAVTLLLSKFKLRAKPWSPGCVNSAATQARIDAGRGHRIARLR